ncbi:MAG: hypothetical protein ACOYN3_02660 [Acidimicrobiia bacterium]
MARANDAHIDTARERGRALCVGYAVCQLLPESNGNGAYPITKLAFAVLQNNDPSVLNEIDEQRAQLCSKLLHAKTQNALGLELAQAQSLVRAFGSLHPENAVRLGIGACGLNAWIRALDASDTKRSMADAAHWSFHIGRMANQMSIELQSQLTADDRSALANAGSSMMATARSFYGQLGNSEMVAYCDQWLARAQDLTRT